MYLHRARSEKTDGAVLSAQCCSSDVLGLIVWSLDQRRDMPWWPQLSLLNFCKPWTVSLSSFKWKIFRGDSLLFRANITTRPGCFSRMIESSHCQAQHIQGTALGREQAQPRRFFSLLLVGARNRFFRPAVRGSSTPLMRQSGFGVN